jgi:hypothetical protein
MNKKFLSIMMLVSAISLRGMDYEQKMSTSNAKAQAALSRAQDRQDPLLNGLTQEQIEKACEATGAWAILGMTEDCGKLPQEDADYDKYLRETLETLGGEDQSQGTFKCGTTGSKDK